MKKNLTFKFFIGIVALCLLSINTGTAQQCFPAGPVTVSGVADANVNTTYSFTGVPVGTVIELVTAQPDDVFNIDLCATNAAGWLDGDHDSSLHILDANSATANYLQGIEDGCTGFAAGQNGWGPDTGVWGATAMGTYYLYITEWDAAATVNCETTSGQTYQVDINITSAGPCDAGNLISPLTQSVCPGESFDITTTGSVADGGFELGFENANTGGTGGTGAGIRLIGLDANDLPLSYDEDLNGILSANAFPVFEGTWEVKLYALDATGADCDSTAITTVSFLSATDPACSGGGPVPCTQLAAGPYNNFAVPPCDATCGTPVTAPFEVWGNEAYTVNTSAGSEYVFEFCTGYDPVNNWPATITVAEWDGTNPGTVLGVVDGCSITFTTLNDGEIIIYVSITGDCGGLENQTDNGAPTLDCGPNGATCPPTVGCEADNWVLNTNSLDICEGTSETLSVGPTAISDGGFQLGFDDSQGGTGASAGGFSLTVTLPYDLDATLGGILAAQNPPLADLGGTWLVTYYALDAAGNRCDSTSVLTVNFLPSSDPACAPTVCEADDWTNPNPLDICEGTSESLTLGGTENADGGFEIGFDDSQGGSGALAGGFTLTGVTYPTDLNEGLSGVLAANNLPNMAGTWLLTGYALDAAGNRCDSTSVLTVNFLPASDPNCGTPVCEADDFTNLGPIDICSGEAETLTLGATAESGGGFQLAFDDSQGGTGGLAGGFFIGATFPYSLDETLNNILPSNSLPNLEGTWLLTAYAIDTNGDRCDSTSVITVNFLPDTDPACSSSACTGGSEAGEWVNSSPINICGSNFDILDVTPDANTGLAGFVLGINNDNTNGTGGPNEEFFLIVNYPYTIDAGLDGYLANQGLPDLEGTWEFTSYVLDLVGGPCDSTSVLTVNFLDDTDPACSSTATPCTQIADGAGPYTDFSVPPCDATCGTPVAPAFGVWGNEGYIMGATAGSEYVFEFCTGYDPVNNWPATITVAEWDGTTAGTILGVVDGCSITFTTPNDGDVMIFVSVTGDCGGVYNQTDNGSPTLDCGPNGATCPPSVGCEAGDWTNANPLDICEGTSETLDVGTTAASDGGFEIGFDDSQGGSGALAGGFTLTGVTYPTDLNEGLSGVLAANNLPNMAGTWLLTGYALDAAGNRCDSTSVLTVNFLPASDPNCGTPVCEADEWTNLGPIDICPGEAEELTLGATAESGGGFQIAFDDSQGGTGGLAGGFFIGADFPYSLDETLNNVLPDNNLPNLEGTWLLTAYAIDTNGDRCDSTSVITVNFLDANDPACAQDPCDNVTINTNATSTNVSCNGANDGTATVVAIGGTVANDYTYLWSVFPTQTTSTATNLAPGTYTVTVSDDNMCSATASVTITEPSAVEVAVDNTTNATCGDDTGEISITASGGAGSYTYSWSNGMMIEGLTGLNPGIYNVTVTDMAGCTATATAEVASNISTDALTVSTSATDDNCGAMDGTAIVDNVTGGSGNYTYAWANGETTSSISNLAAGVYPVTVTDANTGCSGVGSATIGSLGGPNATVDNVADVTCNGGADGEIMITVIGGAGNTYAWSNGETTEDISGLSAGNYTGTITSSNGCEFIVNATVNEPMPIEFDFETANDDCGSGNGAASAVNITGGSGGYSYLWSNNETTASLFNIPGGVYSVTITDGSGCTGTGEVEVTSTNEPDVSIDQVTNVNCNAEANGAITIIAAGNNTYQWSNGETTANLSDLAAGDYICTVTSDNGCTSVISATVTEPLALVATVDDVTGSTGADGSFEITVTGGTGAYSYEWSNGETTEDIFGLAPGDYTCTITDGNGCTVVVTETVGDFSPVEDINEITSFFLTPNPTSGNVRIEMNLSSSHDVELQLFDVTGRTLVFTSRNNTAQAVFELDLSTYSDGVYFAKFIVDGNSTFTERIVKTH